MHVLKTWHVSIKTEFLKQFLVFFSKPEKLSYEVLNGHRRYVTLRCEPYFNVSLIIVNGILVDVHKPQLRTWSLKSRRSLHIVDTAREKGENSDR